MESSGKGKIRVVAILAVVAASLIFIFYKVMNSNKTVENEVMLTTTQAVLQRDLEINYPQSPRAVVKYYAELSQCMYDPSNAERDIEMLAVQSRKLLDDELVSTQSDEEYLASLKREIESFKEDKRSIISYTVSSSTDVEYNTTEMGECATLYCIYTMKKDTVNYSATQQYILRKDSKGHWKILGWQAAAPSGAAE